LALALDIFKVPFHIFAWETITLNSFLLDLALLPGIALGALIGIKAIKLINETVFRYLVMSITFIAAVAIFL